MSTISCHVVDTVRGGPAVGVPVVLEHYAGMEIGRATTGFDGRVASFDEIPAGDYRLIFITDRYFSERDLEVFYPEIHIVIVVGEDQHVHVPVVLSPHSFMTFRGTMQ